MSVKRWRGRRVWSLVDCCVPRGTEGRVTDAGNHRAAVQWVGGPHEIVDVSTLEIAAETVDQRHARLLTERRMHATPEMREMLTPRAVVQSSFPIKKPKLHYADIPAPKKRMDALHICGGRGPRCPSCRSRRTTAIGDHGFCEACGAQFNAGVSRARRVPARERVALSPAGLSIMSKKDRSGPRRRDPRRRT